MVNYQEGKIYKVVNDVNDVIYIGSTCQTLAKRMGEHRKYAKVRTSLFYTAMREIGIERFKVVLIKAFPCNSKAELEAEEYKIMQECNMKLYNDFIGGMSEQHKQKISDNNSQKGKFQTENSKFNYGCVSYSKNNNSYVFIWRENNERKKASFSCNKYGPHQALLLAYEARKSVYPDWLTPEEEALAELSLIEI